MTPESTASANEAAGETESALAQFAHDGIQRRLGFEADARDIR